MELEFDDAQTPVSATRKEARTSAARDMDYDPQVPSDFGPEPEPARTPPRRGPSPSAPREMPRSVEAEASVLSAGILDAAEVMPKCEAKGITPESFTEREHAIIFRAMQSVWRRDGAMDGGVVYAEIQKLGLVGEIGGLAGYSAITGSAPTTALANSHIGVLADMEARRKMIALLAQASERLYDPTEDASELIPNISERVALIADGSKGGLWPKSVSARDLCAQAPVAPPELIHGLLYCGGTMMLSGPSKAHKTYTMLAAGVAIAGGHEWLGFKTTKSPVLYLNLELQDFAVNYRLKSITDAMGVTPPAGLHMLNLRGVMVSLNVLTEKLRAEIVRTGARLVIVDPHYKVSSASGVEENSNDAQAKFLYTIETLCGKNGAAVMLAHHFAKGNASMKNAIDRAAGGGALARWPDVVATLTEHDNAECMTVEMALRNFAPVTPFVVRWTHPVWTRDGSLDASKIKQPGGRKDEHPPEEALRKLGDDMLTKAEWKSRLGWDDRTLKRKVDKLIAEKKVKLVSGLYSARKAGEEMAVESAPPSGHRDLTARLRSAFANRFPWDKRGTYTALYGAACNVERMSNDAFKKILSDFLESGILNTDKNDDKYYVPGA